MVRHPVQRTRLGFNRTGTPDSSRTRRAAAYPQRRRRAPQAQASLPAARSASRRPVSATSSIAAMFSRHKCAALSTTPHRGRGQLVLT
ncbi:MAG: hypothetical protein ACRDSZ_17355, partial [Pseudonocardiaceae bacterium]